MRRVNEDRLYAATIKGSMIAPDFRSWVVKHEELGFDYLMTVLGNHVRTDRCSAPFGDYDGLLAHFRTHGEPEPFSTDFERALAGAHRVWLHVGGRIPQP